MKNENDPAFPQVRNLDPHQIDNLVYQVEGLTKRELFAAMAMQGLLANNEFDRRHKEWARDSVKMADVLLEELEETSE